MQRLSTRRLFAEQNLDPFMKEKIDLKAMSREVDYIEYVIRCYKEAEEEWLKAQPSAKFSQSMLHTSLTIIYETFKAYVDDQEARRISQVKLMI